MTMKNRNKDLVKKLGYIAKRLDMITVILLAKSGFARKEIADVLGVSEKTIERMLPFKKLKQKKCEE
jgi:orotate phosphoribosyltransferase-like protein